MQPSVVDRAQPQVRQLLQFLRAALPDAPYAELARQLEGLSASAKLDLSTALLTQLPTRAHLKAGQQQLVLGAATLLERQRLAKAAIGAGLLQWLDGFGSADVLYDVGASYGLCALYAGLRNPSGRVLACEPAAPDFLSLCANVQMNGLRNVLPVNCALGAQGSFGMLQLSGFERGALAHGLALSEAKPGLAHAHAAVLSTLDQLAGHFQAPTMLRLNCAQSLTGILEGARLTLPDRRLKSVFIDRCDSEEQFEVLACRMSEGGFGCRAAVAPLGVRRDIVFERARETSHDAGATRLAEERSQVLEVRGFLSAAECREIMEARRRAAGGSRSHVRAAGFALPELAAARELLGRARERVLEALNRFYKPASPLLIDVTLISEMLSGDGGGLHADSEELDWTGRWVPNHTPWRRYAALLYLSGSGHEFTGGRLRFPTLGREIVPEQGMLVAFPCGRSHQHEVTRVESGRRCFVAMWTTADARYQESW
jgi:FkbM family methyltransferase